MSVSVASVGVAQVKLSKICVLVPEIAGSGFVTQRTRWADIFESRRCKVWTVAWEAASNPEGKPLETRIVCQARLLQTHTMALFACHIGAQCLRRISQTAELVSNWKQLISLFKKIIFFWLRLKFQVDLDKRHVNRYARLISGINWQLIQVLREGMVDIPPQGKSYWEDFCNGHAMSVEL